MEKMGTVDGGEFGEGKGQGYRHRLPFHVSTRPAPERRDDRDNVKSKQGEKERGSDEPEG